MTKRIVLDAMGGDRAPAAPLRGAQSALRELDMDLEIVLVGDRERIDPLLERGRYPRDRLIVHHAPDVVTMDEPPTRAVRRKPNSSIAIGLELQAAGRADAFVSAGNTGAVMATSLTTLGRIETIGRPAIVTLFPTTGEPCLVLDVGANVDARPRHLVEFAFMGHVYATDVLGRERPRVGLLSIGEEATKGNEQTVATHRLLAASGLEFIGNVEGGDVLRGVADVVVCDGFVGNVLLKFGESLIDFLSGELREKVGSSPRSRIGAFLLRPTLGYLKERLDYAEYGGAPLLGVDGIVIIGHGRSSVKAYRNAIRVAAIAVERELNRHIERAVRDHASHRDPAAHEADPRAAKRKIGEVQ